MSYNINFSRYLFFLTRKYNIAVRSLRYSKIKGRFSDAPKVLLNSLPKSGTHLIERLFFELPMLQHYGGRTIMINTHDNSFEPETKRLKKIHNGQFAPAHIQYNEEIYSFIKAAKIKVVQMIRDPRDVLISQWLYVKDLDKAHKSHKYISSLETDIEQFEAVINGRQNIIEPFADVANKFSGWRSKPDVLTIRFEDLVGSKGGGSDEEQLQTVKKIIAHINLPVKEDKLEIITQKIFSSKSSTFNTGKINKWKTVFTNEHKDICKERIQHILELYGYEQNSSW